ncbi:hypothetical protein Bca101_043776 [Brassica carinata]
MDVACWARINLNCCDAETVPTCLSVKTKRLTKTEDFSIKICQGIGAVCVSDQPGDEAILASQIVSDRRKLGGYGQMTYWDTF